MKLQMSIILVIRVSGTWFGHRFLKPKALFGYRYKRKESECVCFTYGIDNYSWECDSEEY